MDTDILNSIPDCKTCTWWYDVVGECKKPIDIACPNGVRQQQQQVTKNDYTILS